MREGPIADAEAAAAELSTPDQPFGGRGKPFDRRSPFLVGMAAAAGVAATYGLVQLLLGVRGIMLLVGLALFLAVGLEPAVSWLVARRFPRWVAVTTVFLVALAAVGGFVAATIPVLVDQATQLVHRAPGYLEQATERNSLLGQLNERIQLQQRFEQALSGRESVLIGGLLGAGQAVLTALSSFVLLVVLTVYFLADLPRIRAVGYRMVPASRRPRAILLGDEIVAKVGGYVLGNLLISVIAGVVAYAWLLIFGVPYALLLSIMVAILDMIPLVGTITAGIIASLAALTVSLPVGLATIGFFVVYRLVENYLLIPKIIGGVVQVPALATVVAVIVGGALLGVVGAVIAIPVAAALQLLVREMLVPRLDRA
ncbi:putative PurR-regulated permease PerM [Herbihabitans rhizosphaerae]|uniref:Putative PurR-regulated permease PerM n=1 Tax=Herbihabitans rhizosphaerae TaxID=1872711 RepID=A0A4Q7KIF2_9PSEU|nr:AI-2E family transporter [Herbihabitans rhizosphaerae]RZS34701.1 putative PurR-regulated permease PerM [Herbihabitans rhizosphaerae]